MKLSERFDSFTIIELQRAIQTRERSIIKSHSEIKALRKLIASKDPNARLTKSAVA